MTDPREALSAKLLKASDELQAVMYADPRVPPTPATIVALMVLMREAAALLLVEAAPPAIGPMTACGCYALGIACNCQPAPPIPGYASALDQFWCPHVGGFGPPFPCCPICASSPGSGQPTPTDGTI